jgi:hypothetical protein
VSQINGNGGNDRHFTAARLKAAVEESLSILGGSLTRALVEDLSNEGVDLGSNTSSYSVAQLETGLGKLFGKDATELLMDRVKDHLGNH